MSSCTNIKVIANFSKGSKKTGHEISNISVYVLLAVNKWPGSQLFFNFLSI